jgi:hypothetical protein
VSGVSATTPLAAVGDFVLARAMSNSFCPTRELSVRSLSIQDKNLIMQLSST